MIKAETIDDDGICQTHTLHINEIEKGTLYKAESRVVFTARDRVYFVPGEYDIDSMFEQIEGEMEKDNEGQIRKALLEK